MVNSNTSWGKVAGWYNELLEEGKILIRKKLFGQTYSGF